MRVFTDWNCKLLPMMQDVIARPEDSVKAMDLLRERFGIRRFCMMPEFDCRQESVEMFLLRRERSVRELKAILPELYKIQISGCAILSPGLSVIPHLNRLCLPGTNYLPLRLPLAPEQPWIATELNKMLYHTPFRILFTSFDLYGTLYPSDMIRRLASLPDAAYQFNYRALQKEDCRRILNLLLQRHAPILFGTSVNSPGKACFYDFDYYMEQARLHFSEFEREDLFFRNRIYRK